MTLREEHVDEQPGHSVFEAQLFAALQRHDPMRTGCNLNGGMESEYQAEANQAARLIQQGKSISDALRQTFEDHFGADLIDERNAQLLASIANEIRTAGAGA